MNDICNEDSEHLDLHEKIEYKHFTNIGRAWTSEDDTNLIKLYNEDLLDIVKLSIIYKKTPSSIAMRLKQQNIILHTYLARGYNEYINSDLYSEVCENSRFNKKKKSDKKNKSNIENNNFELEFKKSFNKIINKHLINYIEIKNEYEKKIELLTNQIKEIKNEYEEKIEILTNQIKELKNNIEEIYTNNDSNLILIKDKEYILIDDCIYTINKIKGNIYGTYNKTTNKVTKIK